MPREDHQTERKTAKWEERGKKERNFGRSREGDPAEGVRRGAEEGGSQGKEGWGPGRGRGRGGGKK